MLPSAIGGAPRNLVFGVAPLLRVAMWLGLLPVALFSLYASLIVYQRDMISLELHQNARGGVSQHVLLVRDSLPKETALDPTARFLPITQLQQQLGRVDDYQTSASLLSAAAMSRSENVVNAAQTITQDAQPCIKFREHVYCQSNAGASGTPPRVADDKREGITFSTRHLLGVKLYHMQEDDDTKSPPDTEKDWVKISRPGIFAQLIQPLETILLGGMIEWLWWERSTTTLSSSSSSHLPFRRNPDKSSLRHVSDPTQDDEAPLWALLSRPALLFLATLQLALAFLYWNRKVPPSAVAMEYTAIMGAATSHHNDNDNATRDTQLWRLVTGATAHFDLWHIGLNLSALFHLSQHLEKGLQGHASGIYSSLEYLGMNLSLIALVGAVWLLLQRYTRTPEQRAGRPTVGYSGVLFALSVISTLQQPRGTQTCPVPLVDKLCFSTTRIPGTQLPWSWSPWIQLVVAQVLLPRVSWTGHLAGVVVGFLYMWGWVPYLGFPAVYWQLGHLIFLVGVAKVIHNTSKIQSLLRSPKHWGHVVVVMLSVVATGWSPRPVNVSFVLWCIWDALVDATAHNASVVRGHTVATVLHMVTVSLSVAAVLTTTGGTWVAVVQVVQWGLCASALLRHIPWLVEDDDQGDNAHGIFGRLLGPVLWRQPLTWLPCVNTTTHTATTETEVPGRSFPGSGRTLGAGGAGSSPLRSNVDGISRLTRMV